MMGDARKFAIHVVPVAMIFALCSLVQPAAAQQFNDTVAFTITNAAGEGAVPPGCPKSRLYAVNPLRLTRGSLPASDYSCFTKEEDVRGIAAYYAPYAIQAALAYDAIIDESSLNTEMRREFADRTEHVQKLLNRRGWSFVGPDRCLRHRAEDCRARYQADPMGLAYHVWKRTDARGHCREVSVAFRGSVSSLNAWFSNLQQYVPGFDPEYGQIKREFRDALDDIQERVPCRQIVTVGHSLGGGLGQFAALAAAPAGRVAKVVTFNTSPVSGVNLIKDDKLLNENARGLTIDRVNQQGELLSYHFFKKRRQTPASVCDPLIRGVEFNAGAGGSGWLAPYEQHLIFPFASRLVALSYARDTDVEPVRPKLPPSSKQACGNRYEEQDEEAIASAGTSNDRLGFASTGPLMGQQGQDTAVYAYVPDRENAFARLGGARVHKNVAKQVGHRSGKIRLARS